MTKKVFNDYMPGCKKNRLLKRRVDKFCKKLKRSRGYTHFDVAFYQSYATIMGTDGQTWFVPSKNNCCINGYGVEVK